MPKVRVRHDGEQRAAVAADSFADGACQHVVGPFPDSGVRIRRDVARNQFPGCCRFIERRARSFQSRLRWSSGKRPVARRMAVQTSDHAVHEIASTLKSGRRGFEMPIRQLRVRGPRKGRQPTVNEMATGTRTIRTTTSSRTNFVRRLMREKILAKSGRGDDRNDERPVAGHVHRACAWYQTMKS